MREEYRPQELEENKKTAETDISFYLNQKTIEL
jgi:hypothetical protein